MSKKIWNHTGGRGGSLGNPTMKAYPVKHLRLPFFKEKLIQEVLSPASHSLIVFFSFSSSIHFLPTLTVFPPQRIHPKFNYFRGGFSQRNGALSQHSWGSELALRNASPSHTHTQTISAIDECGFTALLQLGRWILRWWFIRVSRFKSLFLCHTFSRAVHTEGPRAQSWTTARIWCFLDDCSYLCRMLLTSDTNGSWQQAAISDIRLVPTPLLLIWKNISVL